MKWQSGGLSKYRGPHRQQWIGHYREYYLDASGQEQSRHRTVRLGPLTLSRHQAKKLLKEHLERASDRAGLPDSSISLEDFIANVYEPAKTPLWERNTAYQHASVVGRHVNPRFGAAALSSLSRASLEAYLGELADKGLGASALTQIRTKMRAVLECAQQNRYLDANPLDGIRTPKTQRSIPKVLDTSEVRLVLSATSGETRLAFSILLLCGLRIGEVLALRTSDVLGTDLRIDESSQHGRLKGTKTGLYRDVPLPISLAADLAAWCEFRQGDALLFPNRLDRPRTQARARETWEAEARQATGIDWLTFQVCRRTFATLLKRYADVRDIQGLLGHKRVQMSLEHYIQPVRESQRAAVERLSQAVRQ